MVVESHGDLDVVAVMLVEDDHDGELLVGVDVALAGQGQYLLESLEEELEERRVVERGGGLLIAESTALAACE